MGITFPSHYPNGAAPSFMFHQSTSIGVTSQQELHRVCAGRGGGVWGCRQSPFRLFFNFCNADHLRSCQFSHQAEQAMPGGLSPVACQDTGVFPGECVWNCVALLHCCGCFFFCVCVCCRLVPCRLSSLRTTTILGDWTTSIFRSRGPVAHTSQPVVSGVQVWGVHFLTLASLSLSLSLHAYRADCVLQQSTWSNNS